MRPPGLCDVSYVVSELARFARGRIEDSSFNRFALNDIPELPATVFFGITRKIKIRKIGNLVFLSIQSIADFSSYTEKKCGRQFWNAVEREPVETRVLNPTASEAS